LGQIGYSLVLGDNGHTSFIHVAKGLKRFIADHSLEVSCQVGTLLNGHLRQLRVTVGKVFISSLETYITQRKNIGCSAHFVVLIYLKPAATTDHFRRQTRNFSPDNPRSPDQNVAVYNLASRKYYLPVNIIFYRCIKLNTHTQP